MRHVLLSKYSLLLVLFIALGVRAAAAVGIDRSLERRGQRFLFGDTESYWVLAEQIRHARSYEYGAPEARVVRMPGFPLLLAGVFLVFGDDVLVVRLVLALLG